MEKFDQNYLYKNLSKWNGKLLKINSRIFFNKRNINIFTFLYKSEQQNLAQSP